MQFTVTRLTVIPDTGAGPSRYATSANPIAASAPSIRAAQATAPPVTDSRSFVSRFTPAALRENKHRIDSRHIAVQSHVTTRRASNDELTPIPGSRTADQRVGLEHGDRLNNFADARRSAVGIMPGEVVKNSIEIVRYFRRQLNPRHLRACSHYVRKCERVAWRANRGA